MNYDMVKIDGVWYEYDFDKANVIVNIDEDIEDSYIKIPSEVKDSDGCLHKVTAIESGAFFMCEKIQAVEIDDGIEEIQKGAFSSCENLKIIKLPSKLSKICDSVFNGCKSLPTVVIPETVKSIGNEAFEFCKSLSEIILPNALESIGKEAFAHCDSLKELYIPQSVLSIGEKVLRSSDALKSIEVDPRNPKYLSQGNCLIERDTGKLIAGCYTSVIPEFVKEIGDNAFEMLYNLRVVKIPQGVKKIGSYAFADCFRLKEVYIPSSVEEIGEKAFSGCHTVKIFCDFAKKPHGWADDLGVNKKSFVWTAKKGLFSWLKKRK